MLFGKQSIITSQHTLSRAIDVSTPGHGDTRARRLTLRPADINTGIVFRRTDVPAAEGLIVARWYNVIETCRGISIGNPYGVCVNAIEQLMGALRGCGVDNAIVELDSAQLPQWQGRQAAIASMIQQTGTCKQDAPRYALWLQETIQVKQDNGFACLSPYFGSRITAALDCNNSLAQTVSLEVCSESLRPGAVRSSGFSREELLQDLNLRNLVCGNPISGGRLIDGACVVYEHGHRWAQDALDNTLLSIYSGLALAGPPLFGHLYMRNPSPELSQALLGELFAHESAWTSISVDAFYALAARTKKPLPAQTSGATCSGRRA